MVGEHVAHALAGTFAPKCDDHALAVGLQGGDVPGRGFEHISAGLGALGGKIAPLLGADIDEMPVPLRLRERGQPRQGRGIEPSTPLGLHEIEPFRRQRLVGRAWPALGERLLACLVIVLDLMEPLAHSILGQRLEDYGTACQVIEKGIESVMEERKPMLHAGVASTFAHRMVENVIGRRRTECFHITEAEASNGLTRKLELGDRQEIQRAQLICRALGFGIEAADRLQRVAEKIKPHRFGHARRVKINDTAAHGIIARLTHR